MQEKSLFQLLVNGEDRDHFTQEDVHRFLQPYSNETYNETKAESL